MEQKYQITLNKTLMELVKLVADARGTGVSEWINQALENQVHAEQKDRIYQLYLEGEF